MLTEVETERKQELIVLYARLCINLKNKKSHAFKRDILNYDGESSLAGGTSVRAKDHVVDIDSHEVAGHVCYHILSFLLFSVYHILHKLQVKYL